MRLRTRHPRGASSYPNASPDPPEVVGTALEVVLEPGGPQYVGPQPAAVQRKQRVGHQRDPRARRELETEGPVDQVVTLVWEVGDVDGTPERQVVAHRARQPQLAFAHLQLRDQVH